MNDDCDYESLINANHELLKHMIFTALKNGVIDRIDETYGEFLEMKKFKQSERTLEPIIKIKSPGNHYFRLFSRNI